jgi:hypothetical protein
VVVVVEEEETVDAMHIIEVTVEAKGEEEMLMAVEEEILKTITA